MATLSLNGASLQFDLRQRFVAWRRQRRELIVLRRLDPHLLDDAGIAAPELAPLAILANRNPWSAIAIGGRPGLGAR